MSENRTPGAAPGTPEERRRARARKKLAAAVACLAVLAVLVAGILLLDARADRLEREELLAQNSATASVEMDTLPATGAADTITFAAGGDALTLTLTADGWQCPQDPGFPVDGTQAQALYDAAASLVAWEGFAADADADYGFADPALTVTLTDSAAGESRTLTVGALNGITGYRYVQLEGSEQLYTVDAAFCDTYDVTLLDLMAMESPTDISTATITSVTLQSPGAEPLILTPVLREAATEDAAATFDLFAAQGGVTQQVDTAKADSIAARISTISYLAGAAWQPDAATLADFGLDEANRTVLSIDYTITDEEGVSVSDTYTLYVGRIAEKESRRYAMAPGQQGVYYINAAKLDKLMGATPETLSVPDEA